MAADVVENQNMGRVVAEITVENMNDLYDAKRGMIPADKIRKLTISNAVVDTGAAFLSLPTRMIHELGLSKAYTKRVTTSRGPAEADVYSAVWLTIQGRSCTLDVMEVPDSVPALVGVLPLEHLDFVVDPIGQRIIGNPEHGGEQVYDLL
jgi:predicted aspartyl protease